MPQGFESPRGHQVLYATNGRLAQLVERYPYKVDVISSSLISTTTFENHKVQLYRFLDFILVTSIYL